MVCICLFSVSLSDLCDSQWSVKPFTFPWKEKSSSLVLKSLPHVLPVFLLPVHFYPSLLKEFWGHAEAISALKVMGMLRSVIKQLTYYSCNGRPLRQSAKLDFNEAIVFIKSNPYELHSQESEGQTRGWVYQHVGLPQGLRNSLKVRVKLSSGNRPQIWLVCLKQNNPFGW